CHSITTHPMHSFSRAHCLAAGGGRRSCLAPLRVGVRFWASLTLRKLAIASGRIVFIIALFMDWQFISGCLPPRLSTTQFPSTTDSQCSVRWDFHPTVGAHSQAHVGMRSRASGVARLDAPFCCFCDALLRYRS